MKEKENIVLIFFIVSLFLVVSIFWVYDESSIDDSLLKQTANESLAAVKLLSKGGHIEYGPQRITEDDMSRYPALLNDIDTEDKYLMVISYQEKGLYLVLNETDVVKEVPANNLAFS